MSIKKIENVGRYLSGADVPIWDCGLILSQPTIANIELFGEDKFLQGFQALIQYEDIVEEVKTGNNELQGIDNFPLLLEVLKTDGGEDLKDSIFTFLSLCFLSYEVELNKHSLDFKQESHGKMVVKGLFGAHNFQSFLDIASDLFSFHGVDTNQGDYNPVDDKAKEIAEKLKKARQKIQQQKGESTDDNGKSLYGGLISILSVGLPCDMRVLYQYTPFQLLDTYNRYMAKLQYDYYERLSMVPLIDLKNVEQPKNWTLPLY